MIRVLIPLLFIAEALLCAAASTRQRRIIQVERNEDETSSVSHRGFLDASTSVVNEQYRALFAHALDGLMMSMMSMPGEGSGKGKGGGKGNGKGQGNGKGECTPASISTDTSFLTSSLVHITHQS